jgi:hypothetical protein
MPKIFFMSCVCVLILFLLSDEDRPWILTSFGRTSSSGDRVAAKGKPQTHRQSCRSRATRCQWRVDECRSQKIAFVCAHQRVAQLEPHVTAALNNCAIHLAKRLNLRQQYPFSVSILRAMFKERKFEVVDEHIIEHAQEGPCRSRRV